LAVFVSETVPEVVIDDPGRFQQIFTNLVSNSVEFTENGCIFVCVHLAQEIDVLTHRLSGYKIGKDPEVNNCDLSNTLSVTGAADLKNNWESFKILLETDSDELFSESDEKGGLGPEKAVANFLGPIAILRIWASCVFYVMTEL
jgi:hypothetical protein